MKDNTFNKEDILKYLNFFINSSALDGYVSLKDMDVMSYDSNHNCYYINGENISKIKEKLSEIAEEITFYTVNNNSYISSTGSSRGINYGESNIDQEIFFTFGFNPKNNKKNNGIYFDTVIFLDGGFDTWSEQPSFYDPGDGGSQGEVRVDFEVLEDTDGPEIEFNTFFDDLLFNDITDEKLLEEKKKEIYDYLTNLLKELYYDCCKNKTITWRN